MSQIEFNYQKQLSFKQYFVPHIYCLYLWLWLLLHAPCDFPGVVQNHDGESQWIRSELGLYCIYHKSHECLLDRLFRRRSKKTSKLRVTGLLAVNSPVNSPHKWPVTRKMVPFDDVIMLCIQSSMMRVRGYSHIVLITQHKCFCCAQCDNTESVLQI